MKEQHAVQGLNSALAGEGSPRNILQEEPADPFDPRKAEQLASLVQGGQLSSAAQGPYNSSLGVNASGAISLCPAVVVLL